MPKDNLNNSLSAEFQAWVNCIHRLIAAGLSLMNKNRVFAFFVLKKNKKKNPPELFAASQM